MTEITKLEPVRYLDEKRLDDQKEKLLADKQKVLTRLQEIQEEQDKLLATKHAIEGALQTVDFFKVSVESDWNKRHIKDNENT